MSKYEKYIVMTVTILITIIFILYCVDCIVYKKELNKSAYCKNTGNCPRSYVTEKPYVYGTDFSFYGTYKSKKANLKNPIIVFGSTVVNGLTDNLNSSFAYMFEKYTKRDVIDFSIGGGSISNLYYLSTQDDFYKKIKNAKDFMYILSYEDLEYVLIPTSQMIAENGFNLHYHLKNGKLVMSDYKNKFLNFFRSIFTVKLINKYFVEMYMNNSFNAEKITDLELLYFTESRKNLEEQLNTKVNFTVCIYGDVLYQDLLVSKLKDNNFNVIEIEKDSISSDEMEIPNWKAIIPQIKSQLKK